MFICDKIPNSRAPGRRPVLPLVAAAAWLLPAATGLAGCGGDPNDPSTELTHAQTAGALQSPPARQTAAAPAPRRRAGRPAGVGVDFVPTPNGWRHRSCVIQVEAEDLVHQDHVEHADGSRRPISPCQYPTYDRVGRVVTRPAARETPADRRPEADGFIAYVASTSTGPVDRLTARWSVPGTPSLDVGQTLFLFPGLEPLATGDIILQPVLAWNGFEDEAWTISSWACCAKDNGFHSEPIPVSPSDPISGAVHGRDCDAGGVCTHWRIVTRDDRTGLSTAFRSIGTGEPMDWVFGGVFEVFAVPTCDALPTGSGRLRFEEIHVRTTAGERVEPAWTPVADITVTPDCKVKFGSPRLLGETSSWLLSWTDAP